MTDERRPVDLVDDAVGTSAEAAELAEHILEENPRHTRKEQFELLIRLIDDAHEAALSASVQLDD